MRTRDDLRIRYDAYRNGAVRMTTLAALLPGMDTVYDGAAATVVGTRESDAGDLVVELDIRGKRVHVGGNPRAQLPVFLGPHPVCSCHGDPWPCNLVWTERQDAIDAMWKAEAELRGSCHRCGNQRNLGRVRYAGRERRRYCRRVACERAAEQWEADFRAAVAQQAAERDLEVASLEASLLEAP